MNKKVGEILIELGFLSGDQVDTILDIQKSKMPDKRFGEIALDQGFIGDDAINSFIAFQVKSHS